MDIILVLLVVLAGVGVVAVFIGWIAEKIYHAVALTYSVFPMEGVVLEKSRKNNVALQMATHSYPWGPYHYYYVYIWVDGRKIELDDYVIYYNVKVGDVVQIDVHKGFNKKGEMRHEYFDVKS